jgi:CAAX protease family protein
MIGPLLISAKPGASGSHRGACCGRRVTAQRGALHFHESSIFAFCLDFGLVGERVAAFLPTLLFCLLINGGPEEPAWRGSALPRLQERFSPVKATLVLGTIWGLWHLPLLLVEDNVDHDLGALAFAGMLVWTLGGFIAYAFTYTYLWNRTRSAPLCMLLHASYTTAISGS